MRKYANFLMFGALWLAGAFLLWRFPGFEMRGFTLGTIAGYLPLLGLAQFGIRPEHEWPLLTLFLMVLLSGAFVALAAWVMDRGRGKIGVSAVLLAAGVLLGVSCGSLGGSYEAWVNSPPVQQAMASPEINFEPTRAAYRRQVVIPRLLGGAMAGLYLAAAVGGVVGCGTLLLRRFRCRTSDPESAAPGTEHDAAESFAAPNPPSASLTISPSAAATVDSD